MEISHIPPGRNLTSADAPRAPMRKAAEQLEIGFLSEMLKAAGVGEQRNSFSGSIGEDQFASFQRRIMAEQMVQAGGIGLSEQFHLAMMEARDD